MAETVAIDEFIIRGQKIKNVENADLSETGKNNIVKTNSGTLQTRGIGDLKMTYMRFITKGDTFFNERTLLASGEQITVLWREGPSRFSAVFHVTDVSSPKNYPAGTTSYNVSLQGLQDTVTQL